MIVTLAVTGRYYVKQDSLYLKDFAQCLNILSENDGVNAEDSALLKREANGCAVAESALHDDFLAKWGQQHAVVAEPTTEMYTSYLLRVCATRPHAEGLAALLPCFWVYMHVGHIMLKKRSSLPEGSTR